MIKQIIYTKEEKLFKGTVMPCSPETDGRACESSRDSKKRKKKKKRLKSSSSLHKSFWAVDALWGAHKLGSSSRDDILVAVNMCVLASVRVGWGGCGG